MCWGGILERPQTNWRGICVKMTWPIAYPFAYFEATQSYLGQHGKPVAFYSDKAAIFRAVQTSTDFAAAPRNTAARCSS